MTKAEQLRAEYNRTFFPDGRNVNPHARMFIEQASISIDGEVFELPRIAVSPVTNMHDLVRLTIAYLQNLPADVKERALPPAEKKERLIGYEDMTYRGTKYLLRHSVLDGEDIFLIKRSQEEEKDPNKELNPSSPAHRAIVKQYRKLLNDRQSEEE
ncbi:hypothetical protein [Phaeodactylibacter sp.]|uniref:hypothetical protein n=1 Tax=Phaeodactylibacter sp. TaxID=1940289 RepID=UPI0025DD2B4E|nr:hypothetical protein [Phaeodactylibacter sp.]MCI4650848.1 hypothetical protein [Phaeodactylibacter sp.]MCI5089805.1 hypothetical protein [Phaeodactylibacter sp.]